MVRVAFLHPDLGMGGAERLVVDAALALKQNGHTVKIFTPHHDKNRCFEETKDGTIPVTVTGSFIPRSLFGAFIALCAYLRMIVAAIYVALFSGYKPDVVFCDQVSVCIPYLRMFHIPVLFYCHYPDQLLARHDTSLRQLYRFTLDRVEEMTTGMASAVVVNSKFTAGVFKQTFSSLKSTPSVLYPSLNTTFFDTKPQTSIKEVLGTDLPQDSIIFLSINRYERKKNLGLAIRALNEYRICVPTLWDRTFLVIAGGYDPRLEENVEYHKELVKITEQLNLTNHVFFLRSPTDDAKLCLLRGSTVLVYTPSNEHFGIVPLEAMYCGVPVVAVDSGGPTETVVCGETGYLKANSPASFAVAMAVIAENRKKREQMGEAGHEHVKNHFSFTAFGKRLDSLVNELSAKPAVRVQKKKE